MADKHSVTRIISRAGLQIACLLLLAACGGGGGDSGGTVVANGSSGGFNGGSANASSAQPNSGYSGAGSNGRPTISGAPLRQVQANTPYEFQPSAIDPEGDELVFRINGSPAWASFDSSTGRLSGTPTKEDIGLYSGIRISVNDGKSVAVLPAFEVMVVAIQKPNRPPEIKGQPANEVAVGNGFFFSPRASDPDDDNLSFEVRNLPSWAAFNAESGNIRGRPAAGDIGTYENITIAVSDGTVSASLPPFSVVVKPSAGTSRGPKISGQPAQTVTVGKTYRFEPTATDPDGDSLSFRISNKPAWADFDSSTGLLRGTPDSNHVGVTQNIVITVSDGTNEQSLAAFSIQVKTAFVTSRKYNPGHYIAMNRRDTREQMREALSQPGVKGIQVRFYWNELERGFDKYDLEELRADLEIAESMGKMLVAIVEDKTFNGDIPTPAYLREYTVANRNRGYTVIRWHPWVVERYLALLDAIGDEFDNHPALEGIAVQESSLSLEDDVLEEYGYTPEIYRDAMITTLQYAAAHFPKSQVFWFMNFLKGNQSYLTDVARAVAPLGVAMGGPDVLPDSRELVENTYPLYDEFNGQMPLFNSLQYDSYFHKHLDTSYPTRYWTMDEMFEFARDDLNVNYLFWNRKKARIPKSSYSWLDALPVIAENPEFN